MKLDYVKNFIYFYFFNCNGEVIYDIFLLRRKDEKVNLYLFVGYVVISNFVAFSWGNLFVCI